MRSRIGLVALVVVGGLLMSSCFAIRGFYWTVGKLKRGDKGVLVLLLRPNQQRSTKVYEIFLIGIPHGENPGDEELALNSPKRMDVKGEFGGPYKLVRDNVMRDHMVGTSANPNPQCTEFVGPNPDNYKWALFRTSKGINDHGRINDVAETRFGFRAMDKAVGAATVRVAAGIWRDGDGDGVYTPGDDDDLAGCDTWINTSIPAGPKGGGPFE